VVFFRPDGRVLYDAPPRKLATRKGAAAPVRPVRPDELRFDLPSYRTGAARWARDREVQLGIEARALEALERATARG
jgi:hypothetical protein